MECPSCQHHNAPAATSCQDCGAVLSLPCSACGESIPAEFRFCGHCGAPRPTAGRTHESDRAERRQLTVMFCDLVESTALAARLDPEDLRDVVRRYQRAAADVVERYGGHVAQYLGDGLLIYFGYPRAHEDDPRRAVMSALEIVRSLSRLSQALAEETGAALAVRVGVHTGEVVAGEIGDREKLALGSTPNVASRVQGLAGPGEVLISEATHARVERFVECEPLGPRALRGLPEPMVLHRALEPTREELVREPIPEEQRTPFVGRETELETLLSLLSEARAGYGQLALVRAEPGFGKSRLQQEFRSRGEGEQETWLTLWCSSDHQNHSLYAVRNFLSRWLEIVPGDSPEQGLAKLEAGLRALEFPLEESVPLLGELLSLPATGYDAAGVSREQERARTLSVLVELVDHMASRGPVVLAVEDLHWVDPSTLEFLSLLLERIATRSVLAVASFRPEFKVPWAQEPHHTVIELRRLTDEDAQRMISAWTLGRELPSEVRRELVLRTDGVPLFLEELTKAVRDNDLAELGAPPSNDASDPARLIPNTLRDSLTSRLDALEEAKEVAQLSALLGREFDYELLEAVSTLSPVALRERLGRVLDSGLIVRDGTSARPRFSFKHALIRDTAYDSLLRSHRRRLHDQVARVLLERFPSLAGDEPETLARHCEEAGRTTEALDAYQRAAVRAAEHYAYVEAGHYFRKALSLVAGQPASPERDERELELLNLSATPVSATSGYAAPELRAIYSRCRELVEALGERVEQLPLMYNFWGLHCVHSDRRETLEACQQIQQLARGSDKPLTQAVAGWVAGGTSFYSGSQVRALEQLAPVVEFYRSGKASAEGSSGRMAGALFLAWLVQGLSMAMRGHPDSTSCLRDAVSHADELGAPHLIAQALSHRIAAAITIGSDLQEIDTLTQRELAISREHRLPQTLNSARMNVAWAAAALGDDAGIDEGRQAIEAQRAGSTVAVPYMLVLLADALTRLHRDDEALPVVEEALELCSTGLCRYFEARAYQLRGELLWRRGARSAGEACLQSALRVAREQAATTLELRAALGLTRMLCEDGRADSGATLLARVRDALPTGARGDYVREATSLLEELRGGAAGVSTGGPRRGRVSP